jgi:26S proteasome regulatory subunit N1
MAELIPLVSDVDIRVASAAALALGHVYVGSAHGEIASVILQTMMERDNSQLDAPITRLMITGLALLYMGREDDDGIEPIKETLRVIEHQISSDAIVLLTALAFAGSGNVLKVQELLSVVYQFSAAQKQKKTEKGNGNAPGAEEIPVTSLSVIFAIIGISLISMGEEVGQEMTLRLFNDLMMSREISIRRTIPLALGLLYASNPAVSVVDWLGRMSHDHDKGTSQSAVIGLGLCAAGTLNAKASQLLRQLSGSGYYQKDSESLFVIRLSQGLVNLGKGTLELSQAKCHRMVVSLVGLGSLISSLLPFTNPSALLHDPTGPSYLFMAGILSAAQPRYLVMLDSESLKSVPLDVRVGQEVDVVGQAGKPKTITGFQTHSTPVLLGYKERAELAGEEDASQLMVPILEDVVIVKRKE